MPPRRAAAAKSSQSAAPTPKAKAPGSKAKSKRFSRVKSKSKPKPKAGAAAEDLIEDSGPSEADGAEQQDPNETIKPPPESSPTPTGEKDAAERAMEAMLGMFHEDDPDHESCVALAKDDVILPSKVKRKAGTSKKKADSGDDDGGYIMHKSRLNQTDAVPTRRSTRANIAPERLDVGAKAPTKEPWEDENYAFDKIARAVQSRENDATALYDSDDESALPDPSQASAHSAFGTPVKRRDDMGNEIFSPSGKVMLGDRQVRHEAFKMMRQKGYLEDNNDDDVKEANRVLDQHEATANKDDTEIELKQERLKVDRNQRAFWTDLPAIDSIVSPEEPVGKAIVENLQVGLRNPLAFHCSLVHSQALKLSPTQASDLLVTMLDVLLHPLCPPALSPRLTAAVIAIVRDKSQLSGPLPVYFVSVLRALGARDQVLPQSTTVAWSTRGMEVDNSESGAMSITQEQRNAALLRMLQVLECLVKASSDLALCALIPVLVRLSVDPRGLPLRGSVSSTLEAMVTKQSSDPSLVSTFRAVVDALRPLSRCGQYTAILSLPARSPTQRSLRRWIAWALLVTPKTVEKANVLNIDALPKYLPIYCSLGWDVAKRKWTMPGEGNPFDARPGAAPEHLRGSINLLHLALSDLTPYLKELATGQKDADNTLDGLRRVAVGLAQLRVRIGNPDAVNGDPERTENWQTAGVLSDLLKQVLSSFETKPTSGVKSIDEHFRPATSQQTVSTSQIPMTSQLP